MERQPRCVLCQVKRGWQVFFISGDGHIRPKHRAPTREAGEALLERFERILDRMAPLDETDPGGLRALLRGGPLDGTMITVPPDRWAIPLGHCAYFRAETSGAQLAEVIAFDWFERASRSRT